MNITKIEIGRLYNLGSYEHVSYKLTVEVPQGESAATAIIGMEKILEALSPKTATHNRGELAREKRQVEEMHRKLSDEGPEEFRRHYGHSFVGTPEEYIGRCEQSHADNVARRNAWEARSAKARKLLEDLGGAANWKDAKLDWENDDNDF